MFGAMEKWWFTFMGCPGFLTTHNLRKIEDLKIL